MQTRAKAHAIWLNVVASTIIDHELYGIKNNEVITHSFMSKVDSFISEIEKKNKSIQAYSILNQKLFLFTSFGKYPYKIFHFITNFYGIGLNSIRNA